MKKIITLITILIITSFDIKAQEVPVIPRPNHVEAGKETFALGQTEAIYYSTPLNFEATYLQNALQEMAGAELTENPE